MASRSLAFLLLLPAALLLEACPARPGLLESLPPAPDGSPESLNALGQAPAWQLTMAQYRYAFASEELGINKQGAIPAGQEGDNDPWTYRLNGLTVHFVPVPCLDLASGDRFYWRVEVQTEDRKLEGCGGVQLPPENLDGTRWEGSRQLVDYRMRDFDGALQFADGRMTGTTGCNDLNADYRVEDMRLIVDNLTMTERACDGLRGRFERDMLQTFSAPANIQFDSRGRMTLFHDIRTMLYFSPADD